MNFSYTDKRLACDRRSFIKAAGMGLGAAMISMPGMGFIKNANAASFSNMKQETIETDVLVIGGGIAGVFAAIKAKEAGVDVTLVDKGTVGKSGLSPWFAVYNVFDRSADVTEAQFVDMCVGMSGNLAHRDYIEMFIEDSMDRYNELVSWGVKTDEKGSRGVIFRKQVKAAGVNIIERTMITDLLKNDGRVAGAIGFPMEEDKAIAIKAKAVVLCAGAGAFKTPGFPISPLTHDGDAMAFKAGAEISGKEFADYHWTHWEDPANLWDNWKSEFGDFRQFKASAEEQMMPSGVVQALLAHKGNVPLVMGSPAGGEMRPPGERPSGGRPGGGERGPGNEGSEGAPGSRSADLPIVGGAAAGSSPHKCEGVFPADNKCASNVPGLFAAGDALFTSGASYMGGGGSSSSGSAVQGGRAGMYAAEYAKKNKSILINNSQIESLKQGLFEPRTREKGYSPKWVTQVLQGIMVPYYVLYIKKQDRLEAALANVEFLREHFAPSLLANDTHELRLVHETRNMLLNAEMRLRASLFRTESRGSHYREDFLDKDDKNWLAWVIISKDGDHMKLAKRDLPEAWKA